MSCKCKETKHVNSSCRDKCKRRCPKIRRCRTFAKWTCPWSICAGQNVLSCCR